MNLKIILEPSEDGGYTPIVPALPGCISEGDSKEEAPRSIREAIDLYLEPVANGERSSFDGGELTAGESFDSIVGRRREYADHGKAMQDVWQTRRVRQRCLFIMRNQSQRSFG